MVKERIRVLNGAPARPDGDYVLYWARVNRRAESNHALLHAVETANRLGLPVLFFEELSFAQPLANARLHTFALEGVPETARRLRQLGIGYCFHLRRNGEDPPDVLGRLARRAACLVTDDYPDYPAARQGAELPAGLEVRCEAVDSSCIVPMRLLDKREYAAYSIRPKIRRLLPQFLVPCPAPRVRRRWSGPPPQWHCPVEEPQIPALAASCDIDHSVPPSLTFRGGRAAAEARLAHFLEHGLRRYAKERNQPAAHATSHLSPYLRFGWISPLETALAAQEAAREQRLIADEFLEELIVRRELAFNFTLHSPNPASLANLPDWARATLLAHARDPRSPCYTRAQFEQARTHDALWNACQKEMLLRGIIHGYYRMYWGKKIIEWSPTCQDALETMLAIHDRYALDGRDPNTYTNILWCFGLHDRPWQERPVFGMVRYMSLDGMKRKTNVEAYLREIAWLEERRTDPFIPGNPQPCASP